MNKNKIYLTVAVLSLAGMLGQYVYYETEAQAQTTYSTYEIKYTSPTQIKGLEMLENAKGCTKLHTNYDDSSGQTGTLIFTCDSRDATPTLTSMTQKAFIDLLAEERGVVLVG